MSEMLLTAYNGSILGPIAKILGWLMNGIYEIMAVIGIENVGLAIILFTIVIYTLMLPLTYNPVKEQDHILLLKKDCILKFSKKPKPPL